MMTSTSLSLILFQVMTNPWLIAVQLRRLYDKNAMFSIAEFRNMYIGDKIL